MSTAEENIRFYSHSLAREPRSPTAPWPGSVSQEGKGGNIFSYVMWQSSPPPDPKGVPSGAVAASRSSRLHKQFRFMNRCSKGKRASFQSPGKNNNKWNPARVWRLSFAADEGSGRRPTLDMCRRSFCLPRRSEWDDQNPRLRQKKEPNWNSATSLHFSVELNLNKQTKKKH